MQLTIVTGPGSQAVATSGKRRLFLFTDRNPSDRAELGKLKKAVREATDARITKLQSMLAKMAPNNDSQSPAHPSNTTNSPPHNRTADQPPPDGNPPGENPSDHTQGNHNQSDAEGP